MSECQIHGNPKLVFFFFRTINLLLHLLHKYEIPLCPLPCNLFAHNYQINYLAEDEPFGNPVFLVTIEDIMISH